MKNLFRRRRKLAAAAANKDKDVKPYKTAAEREREKHLASFRKSRHKMLSHPGDRASAGPPGGNSRSSGGASRRGSTQSQSGAVTASRSILKKSSLKRATVEDNCAELSTASRRNAPRRQYSLEMSLPSTDDEEDETDTFDATGATGSRGAPVKRTSRSTVPAPEPSKKSLRLCRDVGQITNCIWYFL